MAWAVPIIMMLLCRAACTKESVYSEPLCLTTMNQVVLHDAVTVAPVCAHNLMGMFLEVTHCNFADAQSSLAEVLRIHSMGVDFTPRTGLLSPGGVPNECVQRQKYILLQHWTAHGIFYNDSPRMPWFIQILMVFAAVDDHFLG